MIETKIKDLSSKIRVYDDKCKSDFTHIPEISNYNCNYYIGLMDSVTHDLLLAISDDDNTTNWYLITFSGAIEIGESYSNEGNIIHVNKEWLSDIE